jgi:hypothetical protein
LEKRKRETPVSEGRRSLGEVGVCVCVCVREREMLWCVPEVRRSMVCGDSSAPHTHEIEVRIKLKSTFSQSRRTKAIWSGLMSTCRAQHEI